MLSKAPRVVLVAVLAAPSLPAAAQTPIGAEFKVNTTSGSSRSEMYPRVAADPQGNFVVAWARWDGGIHRIFGRRYDAAGQPLSGEFHVNTGPVSYNDRIPSVDHEAGGGFIVAWAGKSTVPPVSNAWPVARRYDPAGVPRGPEFLVATTTFQFARPLVAGADDGSFVVTWVDNFSALARVYDAAGVPLVTVPLPSFAEGLVATPGGGFIVAWAPNVQPYTVWAQRYDAAAVPIGPPISVDTGGNFKYQTRIASGAAGDFTVAWTDAGPSQGEDVGPMIRKFAADGTPLTAPIAVSTFVPGLQLSPALAMMPGGDVVITWESHPINVNCLPPPFPCPPPPPQDGSGAGVIARRLDPAGTFVGPEFIVNTYTSGQQEESSVAADGMGRWVVVWEDWQRNEIRGRRFSGLAGGPLAVDRVATTGSNGNGVFESGERVSVEPSWLNTTAGAITYPGATATLGGPAGPSYALDDPSGAYGAFPPGGVRSCRDQGDCYEASIAGARPAAHWDAVMTETFVPAGAGPSKAWALHVGGSFDDVPLTSAFYRFVETVFHKDVMGGCATGFFCPAFNVPREHMPVFVLQSYQPAFVPPPCVAGSERFLDVPASSPYCRWIEELARRGVVTGCGGGNYCPTLTISRETMAVYLLATMGVSPPPCGAPLFADVPASSPFCRYVEELARRGVVTGCGGGNYCPTLPVARDQMSVFLSVTFGLQLYGP